MSKISKNCSSRTSGGKGNIGMFIERDPQVFAAGVRSAQPYDTVKGTFQYYSLQDEVDALKSDAIIPPEPLPRPTLRHPTQRDMRNAGLFSEGSSLINPPVKTKCEFLADDFKNTVFSSYWKKPVGQVPDQVPNLPKGFNIIETTLGKRTPYSDSLYDVIMPKDPLRQQTSISTPGKQTNRNYCPSSFNRNIAFGKREKADPRGKSAKCAMQDDRLIQGTATYINAIQADLIFANRSRVGEVLTPNNNINYVPKGYAFGTLKSPSNIAECFSNYGINTKAENLKKCIAHFNTVRICLGKRFDGTFFSNMYRELKYYDENNSGWLPKDVVYKFCSSYFIRFDPKYIEPLLSYWDAFNGSEIEYKTFIHMLNHNEECPELPNVWVTPEECLDFRTTYTEMVKPQKPDTSRRAGVPSGRYLDLDYPITPAHYCKADRFYLPEETSCMANLCPSILSLQGVTHRDMFAERSPEVVKRVFKSAGENFTDEQFEKIWNDAKKYHSQGIVCFETFRKALNKYNTVEK